MSGNPRNVLSSRFRSVGLRPEEFIPLVDLIVRWSDCSGEEETVRRLKAIRLLFLHHFLNLPCEVDVWIGRSRHGSNSVRGPFSVLFKLPRKRFTQAWNALMCYSHFRAIRITSRQWTKFEAGVRRAAVSDLGTFRAGGYTSLGITTIQGMGVKVGACAPTGEPLLAYEPKDSLRAPLPSGSVPDVEGVLDSLWWAISSPKVLTDHYGIIGGTMRGVSDLAQHLFQTARERGQPAFRTPWMGRIGVIQEPGYKARFIANPARFWQQVLRPLFRWTVKLNSQLPGNYQYDQDAGRLRAQELLRKYHYSCSVDLSGASDYFPRRLTIAVWEAFGLSREWLLLYNELLNGKWIVPEDWDQARTTSFLQWTVGQPLGLLPTFNGFSAGHLALAVGIAQRCRLREQPIQDCFVLVGDDIVWFDSECARVYMSVLKDIGVPISKDKTLESSTALEFTSRLVTEDRIYAAYKWSGFGDDSFMELARQLGPRVMLLLRPRQRVVVRKLAEVPEPWGLGWNPKGRSFWDRAEWFLSLPLPVRTAKLRTAGEHLARLYYSSSMPVMAGPWIDQTLPDDQSEIDLFSAMFGPVARQSWMFRDHFAVVVENILDVLRRRVRGETVTAKGIIPAILWSDLEPLIAVSGEDEVLRAFLTASRKVYTYYRRNPTHKPMSELVRLEMVLSRFAAGT